MYKFLVINATLSLSALGIIFTFIPESMFAKYKFLSNVSIEINIIFNRIIIFVCVFILVYIFRILYLKFRKSVIIKGKNYNITIIYGDLFKMNNCKKIIPFDECMTIKVGTSPDEIKPNSICGQYLIKNPISNTDLKNKIRQANLNQTKSFSKYKNKETYECGRLIPYDDEYLFLIFTKLDSQGLGILSLDEYKQCLSILWEEIDKHYAQNNICISILGSGTTRINNNLLNQQELLDIIISSYKLSSHKIKPPNALYIVCQKKDDFSLDDIGKAF